MQIHYTEETDTKFELHGYFEEYFDKHTKKLLGAITHEYRDLNRPIGYAGRQNVTLTESTMFSDGTELKASEQTPRDVVTEIIYFCGRIRSK